MALADHQTIEMNPTITLLGTVPLYDFALAPVEETIKDEPTEAVLRIRYFDHRTVVDDVGFAVLPG